MPAGRAMPGIPSFGAGEDAARHGALCAGAVEDVARHGALCAGGGLRRERGRSLHVQLTDRLRDYLRNHLAVGARVPTELALTRLFSVGRSTVRQALGRLVEEGVLVRRQGVGTFVARPVPRMVCRPAGAGGMGGIDVPGPDGEGHATRLLRFGREGRGLRYGLLRCAHGVPHAVTEVELPHDIASAVRRVDAAAHPPCRLLAQHAGVVVTEADFMVHAVAATADVTQALGLPRGAFVLALAYTCRDASGRVVAVIRHLLRADIHGIAGTAMSGASPGAV